MATGTLKMWNAERGYGFIGDDAGGPDVFLHISALDGIRRHRSSQHKERRPADF
jgi:cold shock CspA family protein